MNSGALRNSLLVLALSLGVAITAPAAQEKTAPPVPKGGDIAIFAGGCFWCVESDFDQVPGVLRTVSGYTGGSVKNPTYNKIGRAHV